MAAEATPDVVIPPYRALDSAEVILEELSKLYYESRYTRRLASQRASRLVYVLSKASELVNQREQLRELTRLREQLERIEVAPQQYPALSVLPTGDERGTAP